MKNDVIVGLDIGTTKICTVVGEATDNGLRIIGTGTHPSIGLRKGVVVNIESTVDSIKKSVEEAELMAGCQVTAVYTGIAGGHIMSFNSHGVIGIKNREVTAADKKRVVDAARAVAIPMDREVVHTLVQEYLVDGQDGITDPTGMRGVRLEAKVHMVTAAVTSAHNIIKCCNKAGLDVSDIVLQSLASSLAVLTPDEKDLGTAMVDFGGGTTDLAVFTKGAIKHTFVLGLGGNNLTNDVAVGLRTPMASAETIKRRHGCALTAMIPQEERIEVASVGGRRPREVGRQIVGQIIEPRVEELFTLIDRELVKSDTKRRVTSGLVLTGGSAQLPGLCELGEQVFGLPLRVGEPQGVVGLTDMVKDPAYATAVGLVLYGRQHRVGGPKFPLLSPRLFQQVKDRMKRWIKDMF
ncbi:MAG: cell division protein FtsA [Proteobacteria bacterium]|nr:cell division protein FtsA [Pseudomonadota bacterium]